MLADSKWSSLTLRERSGAALARRESAEKFRRVLPTDLLWKWLKVLEEGREDRDCSEE
jgi:hypothetical protein